MTEERSQHSPDAEDLFLEFARGNATSEAFDALCRANAKHEAALRAMKARWDAIAPKTAPLAERLREKFGESVDLGVSISDDEKKSAGKQSNLVENLRRSGPTGARYRLLGEVARGGMGAILKIWDDDLRRALAMKVVLGSDDSSTGETPAIDPQTLGRFLEEAQITGQLDHPGIVPVHELGLDANGRVYFTMRLVRGEELRTIFEHVRDGTDGWNATRALGVMLKVCEAMSYAHSKGVIHRDLKPGNVMVGKFGEVYVMDWGLARVLGRADKHDLRIKPQPSSTMSRVRTERRETGSETPDSPLITMDGDIVGTPSYMPPEQARGQLDALGPHSDVYSVGAMLYQLVSGEMPYVPHGARMSPYTILNAVLQGPPSSLLQFAPETPAELIAIVEKAMAREITERYSTVQSLADDLRAYIEGRVVRAYETGAWAETRKWVQRNKPLATSIAAALIVAVAGAVAFAMEADEANQRATDESAAKAEAQRNAEAEKLARADADHNAAVAEQKTADVLSLSAQKDLDDLVSEAETMWPAHPAMIPKYESWLSRAKELIDGRPADLAKGVKKRPSLAEHKAKLAELRAKAKPLTDEHSTSERGGFAYDDPEAAWWDRQLSKLIADLEALRDPKSGLMSDTLAEPFGWGVTKRYIFAKEIEERSVTGSDAQRRWAEAIAAIKSSPRYGGLVLKPQLGLLPIGADPESGLWEFAHLQTGEPPVRGPDGKLVLTEAMGLVFVLIPGGKFWMGAQKSDPNGQNYDPQSRDDESPVHEVELSPYFLSKYEMTQGQWQRIAAHNPSGYQPPNTLAPTLLHPVEQVNWIECKTLTERLALSLPSEAQWENGARGGTETAWWTGAERESLRGKVNLADQSAKRAGAPWSDVNDWPDLDDGSALHSEVGHYAANGFGLCEVAGNVWEWCLDGFDIAFYKRSPKVDPVAPWVGSADRVLRGGSFALAASVARSAIRDNNPPGDASFNLGLRPAKGITP